MTDERTTGTTDPATGTAAEAAGGSAAVGTGGSGATQPTAEELWKQLQDKEAENAKLKNTNAQLLSEKSSVEEQRRQLQERPGSDAIADDPRRERYQRIQKAIQDGDPVAEWAAEKEILDEARWALMNVPETYREQTAKYYATGEFRSIPSAYRAMLGDLALQGKPVTTTPTAKPEVREAAKEREEEGEVSTVMRGLSTTQLQERTMKRADYFSKLETMPDGPAKMKLIRDVDANRVTLKD